MGTQKTLEKIPFLSEEIETHSAEAEDDVARILKPPAARELSP